MRREQLRKRAEIDRGEEKQEEKDETEIVRRFGRYGQEA